MPSASEGTQKSVIDRMQTRAELYDVLGYHDYERKLDELFSAKARQVAPVRISPRREQQP